MARGRYNMAAPQSQPSSSDRKGIRRMLMIFGILGIVGVLTMALSVAVGLVVLVAAEGFFVIAYRRFSRGSRPAR